uniref:Uncharacterized protein n=1 Tax=Parascaris univalens TaxID=6257 RepID=A0A914ZIE7_PARUN
MQSLCHQYSSPIGADSLSSINVGGMLTMSSDERTLYAYAECLVDWRDGQALLRGTLIGMHTLQLVPRRPEPGESVNATTTRALGTRAASLSFNKLAPTARPKNSIA